MVIAERVISETPAEPPVRFCGALHPKFLEGLVTGAITDYPEHAICPEACMGGEIQDFHILGLRVPGMTRVACTKPCEAGSQNTLQTP